MKIPLDPLAVLRERSVKTALTVAWERSKPGLTGGHEEGGFVVLTPTDSLVVSHWPGGSMDAIEVPEHRGCKVDGNEIIASFHTHPNTGPDYLQSPGETDRRGVREDVDLKGPLYVGEFVIANEQIYLVAPGGTVHELGSRTDLLA